MLTAWCRWKMPRLFRGDVMVVGESWDLIIESSLNQYLFKMTYRRVLNHLDAGTGETMEAAFYERDTGGICVKWTTVAFEELDRKYKRR